LFYWSSDILYLFFGHASVYRRGQGCRATRP